MGFHRLLRSLREQALLAHRPPAAEIARRDHPFNWFPWPRGTARNGRPALIRRRRATPPATVACAVILDGRLPTSKLKGSKLDQPVGKARRSHVGHQSLVECDVVQRQQNRSEHFVGHEQMSQIATAKLAACWADAFLIKRPLISQMAGVTDP